MKLKISEKMKYALTAVAFLALAGSGMASFAGVEKTGGTYTISGDQFTGGGVLTSGGAYVMFYSAGQPLGHEDMTGGTYNLEGGYVSGVTPVFDITKSIAQVEPPAGYTGSAADRAPGSRLTYEIYILNLGDQGFNVLVEDPFPANLTYSTSSISLTKSGVTNAMTDGMDADQCAYMATDSVHCLIESFQAGATASVVFKAVID